MPTGTATAPRKITKPTLNSNYPTCTPPQTAADRHDICAIRDKMQTICKLGVRLGLLVFFWGDGLDISRLYAD